MAEILEARLADDFFSSDKIRGMIHSKFHNVFNVLFYMPDGSNRLLTILSQNIKGVPDSITVAEETFSKLSLLPVGSVMWRQGFKFYAESTSEVLEVTPDCLRQSELKISNTSSKMTNLQNFMGFPNELEKFSKDNNCISGFSTLAYFKKAGIENELRSFSKAWLDRDSTKMESILLQNTGMGIGLTPSSDDAFLGIIAVFTGARLYANTLNVRRREYFELWSDLLSIRSITQFYRLLSNRTTDVSLKYLKCAQEGRFSDVIIDLIRAMFSDSEGQLEQFIELVSVVGGSSGMDTLFGISIACQELQKSLC